jgi:hypothetical protein
VSNRSAPISAPSSASKGVASPAAARTKLLLEGPILRTLLRLAAPNILTLLAFAGAITFDGFFLGRIGTNALAGASLAFPWVMMILQRPYSDYGRFARYRVDESFPPAGGRSTPEEKISGAKLRCY